MVERFQLCFLNKSGENNIYNFFKALPHSLQITIVQKMNTMYKLFSVSTFSSSVRCTKYRILLVYLNTFYKTYGNKYTAHKTSG